MQPIGYLKNKHASEIGHSPWGVHMLPVHYLPDEFPVDDIREKTLAAGFKWVRIPVFWKAHEREKGKFEWDSLDREINDLRENGVRVFLEITLYGWVAPPFYQEPGFDKRNGILKSPRALEAYRTFALKLAERYRERVNHYELGNEVSEYVPGDYAAVLKDMGRAMRAIHKDHKLLLSVSDMGAKGTRFVDELFADQDAAREIDILAGHTYHSCPEVGSEKLMEALRMIREKKPDIEYWMGEAGWPSSSNTIHMPHSMPYGYAIQAKGMLRRYFNDRIDGAGVSIYFINVEHYGKGIHDVERGSAPGRYPEAYGFNTKGLIQHTTWQPKPAYYAVQNLTAAIDGTYCRVEEEARFEILDPGIFYGIGTPDERPYQTPYQVAMRSGDNPLLAYWLGWRPQEIIRPATTRIACGFRWTEPVRVDLLSGAVYEITMHGSEMEAPLADYPMVIMERSALDLAGKPQQPSHEEILGKLRLIYTREDVKGLDNFYDRI